MDKNHGKSLVTQFKTLKEERSTLEHVWEDAFKYTFPFRGLSFNQQGHQDSSALTNLARKRKAEIFDTTAPDSCRLLAASMISGLTPPNSQWFNLAIPSDSETEVPMDARKWLESASKKIHRQIHSSNYDSASFEFFLDIVVGGQAGLYIDFKPGTGYIFELWSLQDMYCMETLNNKVIDTVYRELRYTCSQAINEFGEPNVPEKVKRCYRENPNDPKLFNFIHCIKPRLRKGKLSQGQRAKALPYESTYVEMDSGMVVKESGYAEFPVVIPRWMNLPNSQYAVGPLDTALPDVKTLNVVRQMVLTNGEMQIAGTFVAKEDGILNASTVRIGPRRIIFAADPNNLKPLQSGGDFRFAESLTDQLQRQIRKVMMSDQLQPQDGPAMTATEVQVRVNLIRRLLGPVFGRFQAEFLQPLITRCFGLAIRNGLLGEPPESIGGFEFAPEYSSPLANAQRLEDLENIQQFEASMAQVVEVAPQILDLYDADAATRSKADLLGVPVGILRDERAVKKLRDERAKQQKEQQAMALAQAQAEEA